MGSDKASVEIQGKPMSQWVSDAMRAVFDTVVVVGRSEPLAGLEAIPDRFGSQLGPLSGLATALEVFESPVVLVAVDQPLIRQETLTQLAVLAAAGESAICVDAVEQVTCAAYGLSLREPAQTALRAAGSIRSMLQENHHIRIERGTWGGWGEDGRSWFSMDTPSDIVKAERRFRMNLLG